jgi:hypothetical protein
MQSYRRGLSIRLALKLRQKHPPFYGNRLLVRFQPEGKKYTMLIAATGAF